MGDTLERAFLAAVGGGIAMACSLLVALVLWTAGAQTLANVVMWPVIIASEAPHWVGNARSSSPYELEVEGARALLGGLLLGTLIYAAITYFLLRRWRAGRDVLAKLERWKGSRE